MKTKVKILMSGIALAAVMLVGTAQGGVYGDPGWTYIYNADAGQDVDGAAYGALDGTWDHDNGSDEWDGTTIGTGRPGGAGIFTEGDDSFLRIQDTGDPRDHGMGDPGSNRKILFAHSITGGAGTNGDDVAGAATIMADGVTMAFRTRLSTTSPLDDLHPDGGGTISTWPAIGNGYEQHDAGKSVYSIRESGNDRIISFAPDVGVLNIGDNSFQMAITDFTQWHEFWIQIVGTGTLGDYTVKIWMDGNADTGNPDGEYTITAAGGDDYGDSYLVMSLGSTGLDGAIDTDYLAYATGLHDPIAYGKLKPSVDAGPDQFIVLPDTQTTLAAEIEDDGDPNHRLNYWWEVDSQPDGSTISGLNLNPLTITIPGTVEPNTLYPVTPTVTIDKVGVYELKLTARDEESDTNDTVKITVWNPSPVAEPNLVIYYNFNEGADKVVHDTGEGIWEPNDITFGYDGLYTDYHLTTYSTQSGIGNDPNWGPGPTTVTAPIVSADFNFGTAMFFDPDFDQAAINDRSLINPDDDYLDGFTECTIMMWIKSSEINTDNGFINFQDPLGNDQRGMRYDSEGSTSGHVDCLKGGFGYGTTGGESDERETSEDTQTTDWQHVALVWKMGEAVKWYINSVEDTGISDYTPINQPLAEYTKIMVGRGGKNAEHWHGWVDEVKIFQRALTQAQIQQEAHILDSPPVITAFPTNQTLVKETDGATLALDVEISDLLGDYQVTWTQLSGPGTLLPEDYSPAQPLAQGTEDVTIDFSGLPWGLYHIGFEVQDADSGSPDDTADLYVFWQEKVQYSTDKDTPMALWKLDDESITDPDVAVVDSSGNGFHGGLKTTDTVDPNLPEWVTPGKIGDALEFLNVGDDQRQYVDLSNVPGTDDITVMCWAKLNVIGHDQFLLDHSPDGDSGKGWTLYFDNNDEIDFRVGSDDSSPDQFTQSYIPGGEWLHIAATFDSTTSMAKLYLGGLLVDSGTTSQAVNDEDITIPMRMAMCADHDSGNVMSGQLDQVRLYDIVLSEFEIAQIAMDDMVVIEDGCQPERWPEQVIVGDISGPAGVPDCYLDLFDVGALAGEWLECRDLNNPSCW